jgi:hypothetical protein
MEPPVPVISVSSSIAAPRGFEAYLLEAQFETGRTDAELVHYRCSKLGFRNDSGLGWHI